MTPQRARVTVIAMPRTGGKDIMRVLFASTGGLGHLQPLLPYARALRERGHEVRIAARDTLTEPIAKNGFAHVVLPTADDAVLKPLWAQANALPKPDVLPFYMDRVFAGVVAEAALPAIGAALTDWKPHLVARESLEFASLIAAEDSGVPHLRVEVHNALTEEGLIPEGFAAIDRARAGIGLAPDAGAAIRSEPAFTSFPAGFDGHLARAGGPAFRVGPPPSIPAKTGRPDWLPPGDDPLIYVTFGTIAQQMDVARHIHRTALDAVEGLPIRVLMTTGKPLDAEVPGPVPDNTRVEAFVPQAEVFPHAAAAVHHGGSGTLLGAFAAGLPMVVTPLFADQPDNAALVAQGGFGRAVPDADAASLRAAIMDLLGDPNAGAAVSNVAAEMAALPNITAAVTAMESHANRA